MAIILAKKNPYSTSYVKNITDIYKAKHYFKSVGSELLFTVFVMLRNGAHSDHSSFKANKRKCFYTSYNCGTHCFRVETKIKMNQEKD